LEASSPIFEMPKIALLFSKYLKSFPKFTHVF
jgi:hypothetical protein